MLSETLLLVLKEKLVTGGLGHTRASPIDLDARRLRDAFISSKPLGKSVVAAGTFGKLPDAVMILCHSIDA